MTYLSIYLSMMLDRVHSRRSCTFLFSFIYFISCTWQLFIHISARVLQYQTNRAQFEMVSLKHKKFVDS